MKLTYSTFLVAIATTVSTAIAFGEERFGLNSGLKGVAERLKSNKKGTKGSKSSSVKDSYKGAKRSKKSKSDQEPDGRKLIDVNVSIQPAYHGIPIFMASEMGWFEELGLNVKISVYASGGPQVAAAAENKTWDFGIAGSPPNVIAGFHDIETIGINNDEGATNIVYGAPGVTEWPPSELSDGMFSVTGSSTGDLLMRLCLDAAGVDYDPDEHFNFAGQGDIISALEDGETLYGALWAPNAYTYSADNPDAEAFCSGSSIGFGILGGLMVRKEWAEENSDIVALILAAYLRGVTTMNNKNARETVLDISQRFYDFVGVTLTTEDIERDLLHRPMFNLDDQLALLERTDLNNDYSVADSYYGQLGQFMFDQGVIESAIEPSDYITNGYMKMVSDHSHLREFAYLGSLA